MDPHTLAKHTILKRYFDGWLPILTSRFGPVLFIDGFAGPGVYRGGEPGSPIIVLNAAKEHRRKITGKVHFLFIEARQDRFERLEEEIEKIRPLPPNFDVDVHHGRFEELERTLDDIHERGSVLVPTLAFIDPFGFTGFPMRLVEKIFKNPRAEVIITFMVRDLDRFLEFRPERMEELYGGTAWRSCLEVENPRERRTCLVQAYEAPLRGVGAKFTLAFEMADKNDNTIYYMVYGTTHRKGMEVMKAAMLHVDRTLHYRFADLVPFEQRRLLEFGVGGTWVELAANEVWDHFAGRVVRVGEVDDYVTCETLFPFQKKILKELLTRTPPAIEYVDPPDRFGTFPRDSMRIRFFPKPSAG